LETCGEFELWTRLGQWKKITYKPGVVLEYTLRRDQLSNNPENILRLAVGRAFAMHRHNSLKVDGQCKIRNINKILHSSYSSFAHHSRVCGHLSIDDLLKSICELEIQQNNHYNSIKFHKKLLSLTMQRSYSLFDCKGLIERTKEQLKKNSIKNNANLILKQYKDMKVFFKKTNCLNTQILQKKILKVNSYFDKYQKLNAFVWKKKHIPLGSISIYDILSFKAFFSDKLIFIEKDYFESKYDHNAKCDPFIYIFLRSLCDRINGPNINLIDQSANLGFKETKDIIINFLEVFKKISIKAEEYPEVLLRKIIPKHVVYTNILSNIALHNFIHVVSFKLSKKLWEKLKKFCDISYWQNKRKKTFHNFMPFVRTFNFGSDRIYKENIRQNLSAVSNFIKSKNISERNILDEYSHKILQLNHKQAAEIALNEYSLFNRSDWENAFQNELKNPAATNETLLIFAKIYNDKLNKLSQNVSSLTEIGNTRKKRKRVAFSCSFWAAPTCIYQILPWLAGSVKWDCELIGFGSYLPESYRDVFHEFHQTDNMPSEVFINYVRSLNIDVFIELTGLSPGNRHLEMIARLAPVQISYMNHTATTGVDNIDYLIADNNCILQNEHKFYSEQILMLQDCFFCFNYERDTFCKRITYPKTKNSINFGVFGSYEKLNPELIRLYATLVKKIPDSKIIFKNTMLKEQKAKNVCKEILQSEGLNNKQFALEYGGDRDNILNSYNDIDISLDTFPYNGGNTIAESLHMGTIPISQKGNRFSSRYGSSILQFANLEQYIAQDEISFIQKAILLSNDKQKRKWAKLEMPFQLQKTFFNKAKFGDNFFSCLSKI
jgi:hypothetical protein